MEWILMFYFNQVISNEQPQWLELQSECLVASRLNNSGQGPSYPMVQFLLSKMREGRRNNKYFHRWTINWIRCWVVKSTLVGNRSYLYKSGDGMNIESSPSLCSETSYIYRNHQAQGITYVIVDKIISCPLLTLAGWLDGMHAFGLRYGILESIHYEDFASRQSFCRIGILHPLNCIYFFPDTAVEMIMLHARCRHLLFLYPTPPCSGLLWYRWLRSC